MCMCAGLCTCAAHYHVLACMHALVLWSCLNQVTLKSCTRNYSRWDRSFPLSSVIFHREAVESMWSTTPWHMSLVCIISWSLLEFSTITQKHILILFIWNDRHLLCTSFCCISLHQFGQGISINQDWGGVSRVYACHSFRMYSMSNVILADEKFILFHQYLRYSHKCDIIVFSIPGTIS